MTPQLLRFGESQSPVVVIDGFSGAPDRIVEMAAGTAPFASADGTYYPGLRHVIAADDGAANGYVTDMLRTLAPFVGGAFDVDGFDLLEASFSMVTRAPASLDPAQRGPHFDSTNPGYFAVLHYLSATAGTAFYRQRSTGIEVVTDDNIHLFVETAQREAVSMRGYTNASNAFFEQIGAVEGVADRLVIYRGNLLHSGIIPDDMNFSSDPRVGRLTVNIFIQGH